MTILVLKCTIKHKNALPQKCSLQTPYIFSPGFEARLIGLDEKHSLCCLPNIQCS
jgi:hypothetical protein